jgi:hypothetical protein
MAVVFTRDQGPLGAVDRSRVKPVSFRAPSFQLTLTPVLTAAAVTCVGTLGASPTIIGRIMMFSSCPSRWQCQTYSQPKSTSWFVTGAGSFVGSTLRNPSVLPIGLVGSTGATSGGIWTQGFVFRDDHLMYSTEPVSSGVGAGELRDPGGFDLATFGASEHRFVDPAASARAKDEIQLSKTDSEVGVLQRHTERRRERHPTIRWAARVHGATDGNVGATRANPESRSSSPG